MIDAKGAANLLLRAGVSFSFLYPPINAFFDPYSWIGYFPKFAHGIVSDILLLHLFGIAEVIIALWILSGKNIFLPSVLATLMLLSIVFFNLGDFQILFRDITIAAMSFSLALSSYRAKSQN